MAREGALLHAGEDEIHDEALERKTDTPRKKWDNFWFYHKWHILIGLVVIFLLSLFVRDLFFRVQPDYKIALVTQGTYPSDTQQKLQEAVEKYGKDLNGDGSVQIEILNFVYPPKNSSDPSAAQLRMASTVKLQADVSNGDSMLFITDENSFQELQNTMSLFGDRDGHRLEQGTMEQERVSLLKCRALAALDGTSSMGTGKVNLLSGLGISLRTEKNEDGSGDRSGDTYYQACRKLLQKLMDG